MKTAAPCGNFVAQFSFNNRLLFLCSGDYPPVIYDLPLANQYIDVQCQEKIKICGPNVVLYCFVLYRVLSHNRFVSLMTEHDEYKEWSVEGIELAIHHFYSESQGLIPQAK